MNASVKPQDKQAPAAQGAADSKAAAQGKGSGTGIGGFFGDLWDSIKEFFSDFKENGSIGSILGGILGLGGAWLAGNFFGGGIMSTILMVALAIPMMLIGSDTIGGWINGALGTSKTDSAQKSSEPSRTREVAQGAAPQKSAAVEQTNGRAATAASPTAEAQSVGAAKALTNEELQALLDKPDNGKDRICAYIDKTTNSLQVRAVADSEPDKLCNIDYETLRRDIFSKVANPTGIEFTPLSDGKIRIVATTMGSLPGASTAQSR